jgi:hypothetical protein
LTDLCVHSCFFRSFLFFFLRYPQLSRMF